MINLPKVVDDCFHKNFRKMVSNFLKEINKLFDEKISFEQISKDLIKEIAEEENFALNIKNILENEINSISYDDEISKINHFNILIMGRSGVGKSTLLNKVLKKEVAKTKDFDYCTKDIESYESEKVSGLRLWDTRGIEYKYNISDVFKDISEKIKALINEKNPDKYIHCIWFCIKGEKGERLNKEIQDIIHNCHNLYNIQKLPIILVFTNSYSTEESMEFIDFARREFQKFDNLYNVKFVSVLAKDKETDILTIPANGIYNLYILLKIILLFFNLRLTFPINNSFFLFFFFCFYFFYFMSKFSFYNISIYKMPNSFSFRIIIFKFSFKISSISKYPFSFYNLSIKPISYYFHFCIIKNKSSFSMF